MTKTTKELYRVVVEYRSLATGQSWFTEIHNVSRLQARKISQSVGTATNGIEIYSAETEAL